ncbi:NAD(P)/FAD-dependent oxidoreductase [Mangrovibacterium diazotrophicum]|uniref:Glycine/D-amino acid oxidase-like deaminating enzyme n=1 Tax=Mangrovibacterium diazotrophicum TaxID=1261403 RepID=A0A419VWG9_9BACT|nr:FAD-binding oxidoreductase [Mangrovibacterium diazotrophicum]RKD86451.1 glycine/D-amino acid oxidase-like deaminating enzyme [Mangrovibacterium diazotrophicum]
MKTDFIIVGQGLAGTLLAHELIKSGQSVQVIDSPNFQKASAVAAGLINPVVFRRLTKSWLIDDLFPKLEETYAELEALLVTKIYYPTKIRKVFGSGEADFWQKKSAENGLSSYLRITPDDSPYNRLKLEHGSGWVEKAGRVDLQSLLNGFREYLIQKECLHELNFDYSRLVIHSDRVDYGDLEAGKIIFCEGHRASQNPFFQQIQFKHTKGEVFRVQANNYNADFILNKAFFLMPVRNNEFRMGATYDWNNLNEITTSDAREELCEKLEQVFSGDYKITEHVAGIRPTTHDRRPILGLHPEFSQVGIFNGLGSKGCMLGPYFAKQFSDMLIDKSSLIHPEVRLSRYC